LKLYLIFFFKFNALVSVKPRCSIVLLPFSAILTNLILFVFYVSNTTGLLLIIKPPCNLSLPLSVQVQPYLGVLCHVPGGTHTQWQSSIMVCIILLCFTFHYTHIAFNKNTRMKKNFKTDLLLLCFGSCYALICVH